MGLNFSKAKDSNYGFETNAIHVGQEPDPTTGAVIPPIYISSTFKQRSPGVHAGYEYGRSHGPTRLALERCVAALEGGAAGFAFASGMAAETTILELLPGGSHIIASDDLYGGTVRLFDRVRAISTGMEISYVDMRQPQAIEAALRPNTKMVWVETPTNPLLKIIDLEMVAQIASKHKLISVCDNTFASPYLQRPIEKGFTLVMHSSTKYLNGHSDVVGGIAVVGKDSEIEERMRFLQNAVGAVPGPFDCYLVHRGIKTLALRMKAHCESALAAAEFLEAHPKIEKVIYPGLKSHPQHALAARQMRGFGGMISAVVKGGLDPARRMLERTELFTLAESLGGVESLIEHPAIMTHASVPPERRRAIGIDDGLIRLSVGIENRDDLIGDLKQALSAA